jgi:DNA (cytosine-5)-methyltransferase 1
MPKRTDPAEKFEQFNDILHKKTVVEFFAGIGLMRMGLEKEGWTVVFANDISADEYEMYSEHFHDSDSHFIIADIHHLNVDVVPSDALATASFPCNDLSLAGMRKGLVGKQFSAYGTCQ